MIPFISYKMCKLIHDRSAPMKIGVGGGERIEGRLQRDVRKLFWVMHCSLS